MEYEIIDKAVLIKSSDIVIKDEQTALDLFMSLCYETKLSSFIINKHNLREDFFYLKNGMAGAILQKVSNYRLKLAIVGDFSIYRSKALMDFIRESNGSDSVFFVESIEKAIEKLSKHKQAIEASDV